MAEPQKRLRTGIRRLSTRVRPGRRSRPRAEIWDSKWASSAYDPIWRMRQIPPEVRQAVDSGWFDPAGRVIDIGCGDGTLAAWLAWRGFDTLGVDFASSAIQRARAAHLPNDRLGELEFAVIDICAPSLDLGTFRTLVDRGCFHGIDTADHGRYTHNVATLAAPGARFMMMVRVTDVPRDPRIQQIRGLFASRFSIDAIDDIVIATDFEGQSRPGIAVYMTRLE